MQYKELASEIKDDDNEFKAGWGRNDLTALRQWMEFRGRSDEDLIDNDFLVTDSEFESLLSAFAEYRVTRSATKTPAKTTTNSIMSRIAKFRALAIEQFGANSEKPLCNFGDAIRHLMKKQALSRLQVAKILADRINKLEENSNMNTGLPRMPKTAKILAASIYFWMTHKYYPDYLEDVEFLEDALGVARGGLVALCPKLKPRSNPWGIRPTTEYGEKLKSLAEMPYRLREDSWPSWLAEEVEKLITWKSFQGPLFEAEGNLELWRKTSADKFKEDFSRVCGYALLPKGKHPKLKGCGMKSEQLGLHLFADKAFMNDFLTFSMMRIGNYNSQHIAFLRIARMLLKPRTGFLWVDKEGIYAGRFREKNPVGDWRAHCEETRNTYQFVLKQLEKKARKSRDPFLVIRQIVDSEHPLSFLYLLVDELLRDVQLMELRVLLRERYLASKGRKGENIDQRRSESGKTPLIAVMMRNATLLAMEAEWPLRCRSLANLRLIKNLFQKPGDERWWVKLEAEELEIKTEKRLEVPYSMETSRLITRYLNEYRVLFKTKTKDGKRLDYVFLRLHEPMRISEQATSEIIRDCSLKYLGICFAIHQLRHIVGTEFKKTLVDGEQRAAEALGITAETVRKVYADYKPEDGAKFIHLYHQKLREELRAKKGRKPGGSAKK